MFLNYLRCHDDIGWGLDYASLRRFGMEERPHKAYLNRYFRGLDGLSGSRGELYNEDLVTGDARLCGTTASLCGLQSALESGDKEAVTKAIDAVVMLHAYMFMQSGIPVLYSGDEVGQLNDDSYHLDPNKAADSRYLHRGKMDWAAAARAEVPGTPEYRVFTALSELENIRADENAFACAAETATLDTGDNGLLAIRRSLNGEDVVGIFNFSAGEKNASISLEGWYRDMLTGEDMTLAEVTVPGNGFYWLKKTN